MQRPVDRGELKRLIRGEKNPKRRHWLQAVGLIAQGYSEQETAKILQVNPHTIGRIVRRYAEKGLEGRIPRYAGSARRWTPEQEQRIQEWGEEGPATREKRVPLRHGPDFQRRIRDELGVEYSWSAVYVGLHRMGWSWLVPRPKHPRRDPAQQEVFKKRDVARCP